MVDSSFHDTLLFLDLLLPKLFRVLIDFILLTLEESGVAWESSSELQELSPYLFLDIIFRREDDDGDLVVEDDLLSVLFVFYVVLRSDSI